MMNDLEARNKLSFVLKEIVAFWDSLDAVPPSIPAEPSKQYMDKLIEKARKLLESEAEGTVSPWAPQ